MMELGSTICTAKSPSCIICPWLKSCQSKKEGTETTLPLAKKRAPKKIVLWTVYIPERKTKKLIMVKNDYAPFLKGQWIFPGKIYIQKDKPKDFDLRHSITNNDIYIKIIPAKKSQLKNINKKSDQQEVCLLYTSPSPRDS